MSSYKVEAVCPSRLRLRYHFDTHTHTHTHTQTHARLCSVQMVSNQGSLLPTAYFPSKRFFYQTVDQNVIYLFFFVSLTEFFCLSCFSPPPPISKKRFTSWKEGRPNQPTHNASECLVAILGRTVTALLPAFIWRQTNHLQDGSLLWWPSVIARRGMKCRFVCLMTLHFTILLTVVHSCVVAKNGCLISTCWKQSHDGVCYSGCHCLSVTLKCWRWIKQFS